MFDRTHRNDYAHDDVNVEPEQQVWSPDVTPGKIPRTLARYFPDVQLQVASRGQSAEADDTASFTPVTRETLGEIDDLLGQLGASSRRDVPAYEVITGTTTAENSRSEMSFRAEPRWRHRNLDFDEGVRRDAERSHRRSQPHPTQSPAAPEDQREAMTPNWGLMLAVHNYQRWHDLPQVRRFLRQGSSFRRSFGAGMDHVEPPPRDPTGQEMHTAIFNTIWAMSMVVRPDQVGHLVIYISGHGGSEGVFGSDDRDGPSLSEPDLRGYAELARDQNIHVTYIIESCNIGLMVTHAQVAMDHDLRSRVDGTGANDERLREELNAARTLNQRGFALSAALLRLYNLRPIATAEARSQAQTQFDAFGAGAAQLLAYLDEPPSGSPDVSPLRSLLERAQRVYESVRQHAPSYAATRRLRRAAAPLLDAINDAINTTLTDVRDSVSGTGARAGAIPVNPGGTDGGGSTAPVQRSAAASSVATGPEIRQIAARGTSTAAQALPHREAIQRSFGHHDVSAIDAHIGGAAAEAAAGIGADAYASGNDVVFAGPPDLALAAHEAAHIVQQRGGVQLSGGVGQAGDAHEQHADAVAARVVNGESAEAVLDTVAQHGAAHGTVQRWAWSQGRRAAERRMATQDWDESAAQQPLAANDGTAAAVRANAQLGFTNDKVETMRRGFGLRNRGPIIDRAFVEAVRGLQGTSGSEGDDEAPTSTSATITGVVDAETVTAMNLGRLLVGLQAARAHYRHQSPWQSATAEEVDGVIAALYPRWGVTADDMRWHPRRGVIISSNFAYAVASWQMWHRRRDEGVNWGKLDARDLGELGAPVPASSSSPATSRGTAPAAAALTTTAPAESASEAATEQSTSARDDASSQAEAETEAQARRDSQLQQYRRRLHGLIRRMRAARRGGDEDLAAVEAETDRAIEETHSALDALELSNIEWSEMDQLATVANRARWLSNEISVQLGATIAGHGGTPRAPRGGTSAASTGPERRTAREARAALDAGGYSLGDAHLANEGWDGRVLHGRASQTATREAVAAEVPRVIASFDGAIGHLTEDRASLESPEPDLRSALLRLCGISYEQIDRLRHRPRGIHVPWRQRDAERISDPSTSERYLSGLARRWRRALRREIAALQRDRGSQARYGTSHPGGRDVVEVDLNRSGVTILNNGGHQIPTRGMRLDPVFAEAMVRFLGALSSLGASAMWTAGFLRSPISPADTHPRGLACDITGFQFGDTLLHLRSGRPMVAPAAGDTAALAAYNAIRGGHSDWFDHATTFSDGRTHEQVMHAITARMRSYFSRIVGPGGNAMHMGHWHVELTSGAVRGPQVRAIHRDTDMPSEVRNRADNRESGWMTPNERASFPDGSE